MSDPIIYTAADGRQLRLSMLKDTRAEAARNTTNIPAEAVDLFNAGVELGRNKDIEGALAQFDAASALAPNWPYPLYQKAFTLLLREKTAAALDCYRAVDALEPRGFFNTRHALAVVEREVAGDYPVGLYLYFLGHEWAPSDDAKRKIMQDILEVAPDFAAAHLKLAEMTPDPKERLEWIELGLEHQPDAETRGLLLLNKAAILNLRLRRDAAIAILGELILDPESTANVSAIAKGVLFDLHQSAQP